MKHARHGLQGARGTALIEFALVVPFLILLTLGVVDLSRAFLVKNILHQAAREGVRTAVVVTAADRAVVEARVRQVAAAANVTVSAITVTAPADRQIGVVVETPFHWLFPGLYNWIGTGFTDGVTLRATAYMRQETP